MQYDIHPDMSDLLAAKEAAPKAGDSGVLRSGWDSYGSRLNRPYPDGMIVRDADKLNAGDVLKISFARGQVESEVKCKV